MNVSAAKQMRIRIAIGSGVDGMDSLFDRNDIRLAGCIDSGGKAKLVKTISAAPRTASVAPGAFYSNPNVGTR